MSNEHAKNPPRGLKGLQRGIFYATKIAGTHFGPGCGPAPESQRVFPADSDMQTVFMNCLNPMTKKAATTGTATLCPEVMNNREAAIFAIGYGTGHTEATQAVLQLLEASRPEKKSQTADEKGQ